MSAFYFKNVPDYRMRGFIAVRDAFDNLRNILQIAEIVNTCPTCLSSHHEADFDFVIFSGSFSRALISKSDGYFSMSIPFQIIDHGEHISFNFDKAGTEVDGQFISIMRNAILTSRDECFSYDDIVHSIHESFGLEIPDATHYYDAYIALLMEDHGYLRFDDDPDREDGNIHPRYHFDFFYKNSSSVKIGIKSAADIDCFHSLFDSSRPKRYLTE
ncbi:hypothetical protein ACJJIC_16925 [Microbulbifer sp. ANSA002]|uniref:Uncharacterized protein n=1 Tax=Microbulbifer variabilis TaxID=266805 RepID=A0ABY4V7Q3_9GAMM|nr:hypothetical protein [Microbulbifer variabilis]USD20202.1 hypothetical protein MJO52_14065 [Microbulbifer variabilis]